VATGYDNSPKGGLMIEDDRVIEEDLQRTRRRGEIDMRKSKWKRGQLNRQEIRV
jgi:hypothetical protein